MTAHQLDCNQPSPSLLPKFKMLNGVSQCLFAYVKIIEWHTKLCKQRKTGDICTFKIRMCIYGDLCLLLPQTEWETLQRSLLMVPNLAR